MTKDSAFPAQLSAVGLVPSASPSDCESALAPSAFATYYDTVKIKPHSDPESAPKSRRTGPLEWPAAFLGSLRGHSSPGLARTADRRNAEPASLFEELYSVKGHAARFTFARLCAGHFATGARPKFHGRTHKNPGFNDKIQCGFTAFAMRGSDAILMRASDPISQT